MYISFDGPDATGKTTVCRALAEKLRASGAEVLLTREPGSAESGICQQIRSILLDSAEHIHPRTELLLFLADRVQHLESVVRPALQAGKIVISDRSGISGLVYAASSGANLDTCRTLWKWGQTLWPDRVFLSSADPDWIDSKLFERTSDLIESRGGNFHQLVRLQFNKLSSNPQEYLGEFPEETKIITLPDTSVTPVDTMIKIIMNRL